MSRVLETTSRADSNEWPSSSPRHAPDRQGVDRSVLAAVAMVNALLVGGGLARAQAPTPTPAPSTPGTPPSGSTQLPEILVTGSNGYQAQSLSLQKFPDPLLTTPRTADVVTPELMQEQAITSLRDALRDVSGISIGAGEGSYQGDNFSIRGFHSRSDMFLDGMTDFGNYNRDPFNTEQVEVLKGPSSVEFGRGSVGGVVNMESKTPQLQTFTAGSAEWGTDHTERMTLDFNEPIAALPGAAFRLDLMGNHNNITDRDDTMYERWGVAPSLAFGIGSPTRLTLSYFHQSEDNRPDYGLPWYFDRPAPVSWNNFYGFPSDYFKTNVNIGTIHFEHDFNDTFTLREQVRYASYEKAFRITEAGLPDDVTPQTPLSDIDIERSTIDGMGRDNLFDEDINLVSKFATGPLNHHLITGFEYVRETDSTSRIEPGWENVPDTSLLYPNNNQPFTGFGPTSTLDHSLISTVSAYATDTVKIGERWSVIGGVRYDHVDASYRETVPPTQRLSEDVNLFSWRAAIVFQPATNGSIYLSSGSAVHPNIAQLALSNETILPASVANIRDGKDIEVELGTKWNFCENRFSLTSAIFLDEETNPAPVDLDDPIFINGKERVYGFEVSLQGKITKEWKVLVNYSYDYGTVTASNDPTMIGIPLLNAPKNTVSAWTTYDLPWNLQIGAGLNALSTRTAAVSPDPANGLIQQAPGYVIFSAMLKYRISKNIEIQLNGTNLGDRYYYDGVHPGHVTTGEGRTVFISTNFKF